MAKSEQLWINRFPTISGISSSVQRTCSKDDPVQNNVSYPALKLFNQMLARVFGGVRRPKVARIRAIIDLGIPGRFSHFVLNSQASQDQNMFRRWTTPLKNSIGCNHACKERDVKAQGGEIRAMLDQWTPKNFGHIILGSANMFQR